MSSAAPLDLGGVDYAKFLACVHCGLCTSACPTYLETGNENDSPRGRIHLMRAVADGRIEPTPEVQRHLDLCLDCRSCETACPSGVQYGSLIEGFRIAQEPMRTRGVVDETLRSLAILNLFPYPWLVRPAMVGARLFQNLGIESLLRRLGILERLPAQVQKMLEMLPAQGTWQTRKPIPELVRAQGPRRAKVAFFAGCALSEMFPETNYNTVMVLARNGCDVITPAAQACCGAIHYHAAQPGPAIEFAKRNVDLFNSLGVDAIVNNCAGCGHMLRHYTEVLEHEHVYKEAAAKFQAKVKDFSEYLAQLGPVTPPNEIKTTVAYHDACHLVHGQKVRVEPRKLLAAIPGVKLVPLRESDICCGAAGTYNLTQPEMSLQLSARKAANIKDTGASTVVVGNQSCAMQIRQAVRRAELPVEVIHPADLLARAYGIH